MMRDPLPTGPGHGAQTKPATRPDPRGDTMPAAGLGAPPEHRKLRPDPAGPTVGVPQKELGYEPVVGWLVCVKGADQGRDYRIQAGSNFIGRDSVRDNHIIINGDDTISRRHHAEIVYDHIDNTFFINRKKNPHVRINGKIVRQDCDLKANDMLQLGESHFIFIPLCSDKFKWEKK